jgi:IrrE N-terminal-like domain
MATPNGSASRLERAEAAAARLVAKHRLVPPIDIKSVAQLYADLEVDAIPGDCDGLTLNLNGTGHDRPRIIVRGDRGRPRMRFTIAHELGHIVMFWHMGHGMACHVQATSPLGSRRDWREELEANRFASDVLVPREWLARLILAIGPEHPEELVKVVAKAQVSAPVACLALIRALPPGHAFELLGEDGRSNLADYSPGSLALVPGLPSSANSPTHPQIQRREIRYGRRRIVWRRWGVSQASLSHDDPAEVLAVLLARHPHCERAIAHLNDAALPQALAKARRDGLVSTRFLVQHYRRAVAEHAGLPLEVLQDIDLIRWIESLATLHAAAAAQ